MKYQVKDPQGQTHIIEGPDGATPEQVIAQAQNLIPQQKGPDWKGVVGGAVKEAFMRPGTMTRDLMTNPVTQAKALPPLMGMVGGMSPIPGGSTMGTVGGRQLSNLALKTYGKPEEIPSRNSQIGEAGVSLVGDLIAFPGIKKAYFGKKIGDAERAAGVVTRAPTKAVTPGSVGQTLNDLEAQIDAGAINTPQLAKDAKAVISQIYKNPKIYEQTEEISTQAQRVSSKVSNLINKIPGRSAPSGELAKGMVLQNLIKQAYRKTPWPIRVGAEGAMGALGIKKLSDIIGGQ